MSTPKTFRDLQKIASDEIMNQAVDVDKALVDKDETAVKQLVKWAIQNLIAGINALEPVPVDRSAAEKFNEYKTYHTGGGALKNLKYLQWKGAEGHGLHRAD